jgi:hypothetical protein
VADGNYTDFTPEKVKKFLKELAKMPNVSRACRVVGIARKTAYDRRDIDAEFAAAWDDAKEAGIEALEEKVWRRAEKESDTLAIFLLKAHKPALYNVPAKQEHSGPDGKPIMFRNADELTDDELALIAAGSGDGTAETP